MKMMEPLPDNKSASKNWQKVVIHVIVWLFLIRAKEVVNWFQYLLDSECLSDDNCTQDPTDRWDPHSAAVFSLLRLFIKASK